MVTSLRSKWTAGKAVRAGLALGGRISESIRDRRATRPPAHFQRNPPGRGRLAVRENQSRRDLTRVAQYEVLGNKAKNRSVPSASGTIETVGFWSLARASATAAFVDRPVRDGLLFKNANPALRTGLLSL